MKTHTFSWRLSEDWRWKWRFCEWKWQFWERERRRRQSCARDVRETEKFLKNCLRFNLICAKHAFFATQLTRNWVAKIPWTRFWKISLSLFRDWDFHKLVSHERLWVNSRLGLPLAKESRKWVSKKSKIQIFENFLSVFHDWKSHLPESRKPFHVTLRLGP